MANETKSTTLTSTLPVAVRREAILTVAHRSTLKQFVTRSENKSATKFPVYPELVAAAITEGNEVANQAVTTTGPTITPVAVAARARLMKQAVEQGSDQAAITIGRQLGASIASKQNQDIFALGSAFQGGTTIGTTNVNITEALIEQGIALLAAANAQGPYFMACTPHVMSDLRALYDTNANNTSFRVRDGVFDTGLVTNLFGVNIIQVSDLAVGTSATQRDAADIICPMWSAQAIGMVESQDIIVEGKYEPTYLGTDIVASAFYAVAEINDVWGVGLLVDNKNA